MGCFLAAVIIAYYLVMLFQAIWPRRNPSIEAEFATKTDLTKLETDLKAMLAALSGTSDAGREKVAEKLSELTSICTRLETLAQNWPVQLQALEIKMDAMDGRRVEDTNNAFHRINSISRESTACVTKVEMLEKQIAKK